MTIMAAVYKNLRRCTLVKFQSDNSSNSGVIQLVVHDITTMAPSKTVLLPLLAAAPYAAAWGMLGHATVAFVAQNFVSPKTAKFAQQVLGDNTKQYLGAIASWPDTYRKEPGGEFSAVYHYIDALDQPPQKCNVVYERDCADEGCIVSALANYSSRAVTPSLGKLQQEQALKFIVHFLGDMHQPLHLEHLYVGGNGINVTFNGVKTNLHAVWDNNIPEKLIGNFTLERAHDWASDLTREIKHGQYKKESKAWTRGMNPAKPIDSAMIWANDGNALVCTTVLPDGADPLFNQEVSGNYYETAIPVVQKQIAKAGFRLAAWLDRIVEAAEKNGGHGPGNGKPGKGPGHGKDPGNGNGKGPGNGKPHGYNGKRGEYKLEPWMEAARQARRDFGGDCGCAAGLHEE